MNVTGFIRGYLAKGLNGEKFIQLVANTIENQLKEWDENYEVMVLKLKDYEFYITNEGKEYSCQISKEELNRLQNKSPFSVDKRIWLELERQGLKIFKGYGDYLDKVL